MLQKCFLVSISGSGTVQGLNFCFWEGSGSYFLLLGWFRVSFSCLGRFRVSFSASGTVQGLNFCFWEGSGSYFLLLGRFRVLFSASGAVQGLNFCFWGIPKKGRPGFHGKVQFLLISHVARTPLPGQVRNCFWNGSGPHFLFLGRFRVSFSVSGTVQGPIFCFWDGSGFQFLLLGRFRVWFSASGAVQGLNFFLWRFPKKGRPGFHGKVPFLLVSHVARTPLPGQVRNCCLISVSGTVQGLIFCFWDGSGSRFLFLGRCRVSISLSGRVQGLIFCFCHIMPRSS